MKNPKLQPADCFVGNFFGKIFILTWNPDFVKDVFVKPNQQVWNKLDQVFSESFSEIIGDSVVQVEGLKWKKQRQILNPSFKYSHLNNLIPGFHTIATTLCHQLDIECKNNQFEPYYWMSRATVDALGKCGFGMDFDALHGKISEIYCAYEGILKIFTNPLFLIKGFSKLPIKSNKEFKKSMNDFKKWSIITIEKQLKKMEDPNRSHEPNLLDAMIESHFAENSQLTEKELLNNIFIFFLAGHETTSGTLTFVLESLARHHDIQEKCRDEIKSLFQWGEIPTPEKLKKLHYLNLVINETLRVYPLVSAISREAKEDTQLNGYFIPKGTVVAAAIGNLQYRSDYWENSTTFDPSRWEDKIHNAPHFMPFGAGPRICLGMKFAKLEMQVVLINLLLRFKFDILSDMKFQRGITLRPKEGYQLKISCLK